MSPRALVLIGARKWAGHNSVAFTVTRHGVLFEDGSEAAIDQLDACSEADQRKQKPGRQGVKIGSKSQRVPGSILATSELKQNTHPRASGLVKMVFLVVGLSGLEPLTSALSGEFMGSHSRR
jgi:hypothetical protein